MDGEHGEALVVSLGTYDHHPHYDLPDADRHAEEFRLLARRLGFTADVPPVTGTKDEVVQSLRGFAKSPARRRLVYWIGHGVQTGRDQTVLPCRDYSPDGLDGHLRPGELADLVRRMSGDVLLVIDACHAAFTAQDVYTDVFRSEDNHFGPRPLAKGSADFRGVGVLGTVRGDERAQLGTWLNAFRAVCDNPLFEFRERLLWTPYAQALHAAEVIEAVNTVLAEDCVYPQLHGGQRLLGLFVNPYHDAMARPLSAAAPSRRRELLDAHVQDLLKRRFTGLLLEDDTAYFTGRKHCLDRLVEWLAAPDRSGALIVTGSPGSGKSALLAQLALMTVSHTPQSEGLSPERRGALLYAIDAGIQCRGRSAVECARELAGGLRVKEPEDGWPDLRAVMDDLLAACRSAASVAFLVDGLDEADRTQLDTLIADVLVPLAQEPNVRVLIGTRPLDGGAAPLLDGATTLDLDTAPDRDADIAGYVRARLSGPASPYRDAEETLEWVCQELVRRSQGTFLVAKLLSSALLRLNKRVGPGDAAFRRILASGLEDAWDHEIRALDDAAPGAEPGSGWALGLLLPLALSFGAGLPEDDKTWLTAARALAAARGDVRVYGETDVIWIRRVAGAHIVAHGEGGQPVFRLNHEALAHHVLRSSGLTDQVAHEAMTQVLRTIHEQLYRGRVTTNPYIARYAAAHASRAGLLPELLDDGDLLVRLDPERFVAQLEQSAATSARAQLYRSVADDLVRRTPEERAALLQAAALRQHPELRAWARSAARLHWEDLWTTAEWSAPERSIALPFGDVLTVSAGPDGSLLFAGERLWRWTGTHGRPDLVRGYLPADAHGNPVRLRALATPPRLCEVEAVAADAERVLVWSRGNSGRVHVLGWGAPVSSVAVGPADDAEIVAAGSGTYAAVWEWRDGRPRHLGFWASGVGRVCALAVTTPGRGPRLLVGGERGAAVLDPRTGRCLGRFAAEAGRIECLSATTADGRCWVAAVCTAGPQIRVWLLQEPPEDGRGTDGAQDTDGPRPEPVLGAWLRHPSGATVALDESAGGAGPLLVAVDGGQVRRWSLADGHELGPLTGHRSRPTSVTVLRDDTRRVAVADGRRVRLWEHGSSADPRRGGRTGLPTMGTEHAGALVCPSPEQGAVALAAGRAARAWDLTGRVLHDESELALYTSLDLRADASGTVWWAAGGQSTTEGPVVVVRRFDGRSATTLPLAPGADGAVTAVALATRGDVRVFAADDRYIYRWDVRASKMLPRLHVPNDKVRHLTYVESPAGRPFLLAGAGDSVWLWDEGRAESPLRLRLPEKSPVREVAGTHDDLGGRHVAVAADAGVYTARLPAEDGAEPPSAVLLRPLSTTVTSVRSLACRSLPGSRVLVMAADGSHVLHLWEVGEAARSLAVPDRGFQVVGVLAQPEPNGRGLLVASVGRERMDLLRVTPPGP
ncbi:hypothetical protein GCM10010266_57060 [Streptomyces griseomycini]|uniref:caspase family protein n=1 Tax=Streptomyces griseomycini TaxID=66895 RepID=UPI001876B0FC|nr:caspase family protein [Streptomyces griseomycini]GGQ26310.1 hypothetical protein GCM10010266_57060 [Streptomyces griseomycini]